MSAAVGADGIAGNVPLYRVWKANRAGNIPYGQACGLARNGTLPGAIVSPDGHSLEILASSVPAAEAAMRRDA